MASSAASPASILLRKSINAATAAQSAEERVGRHFWRKYRLQAYKMWFFALTFALQATDSFSDVFAEGTYFFYSSDSGNTTRGSSSADGVLRNMTHLESNNSAAEVLGEEPLIMGGTFDICYALHGVASFVISGIIMWKVVTVYVHMRKTRRERKVLQTSAAASGEKGGGRATPALHRAATQLHQLDGEGGRTHQQQASSGGNGVSVAQAPR